MVVLHVLETSEQASNNGRRRVCRGQEFSEICKWRLVQLTTEQVRMLLNLGERLADDIPALWSVKTGQSSPPSAEIPIKLTKDILKILRHQLQHSSLDPILPLQLSHRRRRRKLPVDEPPRLDRCCHLIPREASG